VDITRCHAVGCCQVNAECRFDAIIPLFIPASASPEDRLSIEDLQITRNGDNSPEKCHVCQVRFLIGHGAPMSIQCSVPSQGEDATKNLPDDNRSEIRERHNATFRTLTMQGDPPDVMCITITRGAAQIAHPFKVKFGHTSDRFDAHRAFQQSQAFNVTYSLIGVVLQRGNTQGGWFCQLSAIDCPRT
jgi:hypothetical protein